MKQLGLIISLIVLVLITSYIFTQHPWGKKQEQQQTPRQQASLQDIHDLPIQAAPPPKLTDISKEPGSTYAYSYTISQNVSASFVKKGVDQPSYEIKRDDLSLNFTLQEKAQLIKAEGNTVEYAVTVSGIPMVLKYTVSENAVKEEFTIEKKPDLSKLQNIAIHFAVQSDGLTAENQPDQTVLFKSKDSQLYWQIQPPTIKDAKGKDGETTGILQNNSYTLNVKSGFLESASYPVVIDPTVIINTTSDTSANQNSIIVTSDGTIHAFIQVGTQTATCGGSSKSGLLWFDSTDSGTTWTCQDQLSSSTSPLFYANARTDSSDNIYVVYSVSTTGRNDAYDVFYQKLTKGAGATWTLESPQTVLNGSGTATAYHYAVIEVEGTTRLWLATRYYTGTSTSYQIAVYYSDGFSATPAWTQSSGSLSSVAGTSGTNIPKITRAGSNTVVVYNGTNGQTVDLRLHADTDSLTNWSTENGYEQGLYPFGTSLNAVGSTAGKVYVAYGCGGTALCVNVYNGTTWERFTSAASSGAAPLSLSTDGTNLWLFQKDTTGLSTNLSGDAKLVYKKAIPPNLVGYYSTATSVVSYHGTFDKYWSYVASAYTDDTTDAGNTTSADTQTVTSTDDIAYFGKTEAFDALSWDLSTSGVGGTATWEYCSAVDGSTTCTTWSALTFSASSNTNLTADGWGAFTAPADWVAAKVNSESTAYYYIRARATGNYSTSPVGVEMAAIPQINWDNVTSAVVNNTIHVIWTENASSPVRVRYASISATAATAPSQTANLSPVTAAYAEIDWATKGSTMKHLVRTSDGTLHAFIQSGPRLACGADTSSNNNNGLNWIYSTDSGATWTCGGQLSTDTDTNQTIGTAPNADARVDSSDNIYVVYSGVTYRGTGFDVFYRKLTKGTGASWTVGNAQTALDSTSGTTGYSYSVMELEGSTRLWLATRYFDGTNYQIQVYYSGDLSDAPTWTQSAASLDTAGASSNYHKLTIVRFGPKIGIIYADQGSGGDLKWRYRADSDDLTSWNAEATISTTFSAIYPTFSAVSDTSNNIYLAVNDGTVVYFTYYNGSGWSSLATVSSVAASDQYVSLETDNTSVWVVYGQTTDLSAFLVAYDYNTLVYKKGVAPFATANFDANSTRVVSYHRIFDKVWTYISSAYTDDTTDAGDTGSNDVAMPAVTGDIIYFGMDEKFDAIAFELYTDGEGGIIAWEYYNGSAWMPLNVYFDTALSLFAGDGGYISFNPHTDWATTQINGEGTAYYYVRARVITDFTITPAGVMMVAMPTVNYASVADTPAGLFAIWTENRYGPTRVRYQTILTHPITASQDVRFKGTTRIQGPIRIKLN